MPDTDEAVRRAARQGMSWQGLATITAQALQMASTLSAAALIGPAEFALWGIAAVFFNAQHLVGSLGFGPALIYLRDDERFQVAVDTAATATTVLTLALGLAAFLLARPLAALFGNGFEAGTVESVIRAMCLVFVFAALAQLPQALLEKSLDFRRRALPEIACAILYAILVFTGLAMAMGVWSLILGRLVQTGLLLALLWSVAPVRPRLPPRLDLDMARRLFAYGKYVTAAAVVGVLFSNADRMAVGILAGAEPLGAYALAYSVATLAPTFLSLSLGKVFFPIYAAVRDDEAALRAAVADGLHYLGLVMLPVTAALFLVAPGALVDAFGAEWEAARVLLRILAGYGLMRALTLAANLILIGTGRPGAVVAVEGATIAGVALTLPIFARFGAPGIACAFAVGQAAAAATGFLMTRDAWSTEALPRLGMPALASLAATAAGLWARTLPDGAWRGWATGVTFGLAYLGALGIAHLLVRPVRRATASRATEAPPNPGTETGRPRA